MRAGPLCQCPEAMTPGPCHGPSGWCLRPAHFPHTSPVEMAHFPDFVRRKLQDYTFLEQNLGSVPSPLGKCVGSVKAGPTSHWGHGAGRDACHRTRSDPVRSNRTARIRILEHQIASGREGQWPQWLVGPAGTLPTHFPSGDGTLPRFCSKKV